jgi:DNA modification methylase
MPKFNDFDLSKWKELTDIETNSLWIVGRRDNTGKHDGFYHGNFIPQIPQQFIKRYTKKGDVVLDAFLGSGTTAFECEKLERNFIGIDLNPEMVDFVKKKLQNDVELIKPPTKDKIFLECLQGDSTDIKIFNKINKILGENKVQLTILHPPYFDIIKFSDKREDLSNATTIQEFLSMFARVIENCKSVMVKDSYLIIVIGDKYANSEWIPLGFYCMQEVQKQGMLLKSIIVKNMEGNRAKQNQEAIWRYRALNSDYYIFKHEYIYVFKNVTN